MEGEQEKSGAAVEGDAALGGEGGAQGDCSPRLGLFGRV